MERRDDGSKHCTCVVDFAVHAVKDWSKDEEK